MVTDPEDQTVELAASDNNPRQNFESSPGAANSNSNISLQGLTPDAEVDEREPKLYVDVNVANFGLQRIVVYEGDTVESLVANFVQKCPIDQPMIEKLKNLLQQQMDGVLERIEEDEE